MKKKILIALIVVLALFGANSISADEQPSADKKIQVLIFHMDSCPHCKRMISYIEGLKINNPRLDIYKYEITSNTNNIAFLQALTEVYKNDTQYVPIIYIGDQAIIGEDQANVDKAINQCISNGCQNPSEKVDQKYFSNANNNTAASSGQPSSNSNSTGFIILIVTGVAVLGYIGYTVLKNKKNK